jgi:hypothetical protein
MIPELAGIPAGVPSGAGNLAVADGQHWAPRGTGAPHLAGNADIAGRIELDHPGYHVWVSDAGWWYATRTKTWAHGQAATVHGPGPGELCGALAEEEAASMGRAMTGAW